MGWHGSLILGSQGVKVVEVQGLGVPRPPESWGIRVVMVQGVGRGAPAAGVLRRGGGHTHGC